MHPLGVHGWYRRARQHSSQFSCHDSCPMTDIKPGKAAWRSSAISIAFRCHDAGIQNPDPLPPVETAAAVRDLTARMIAKVYAGQLHSRVAAGLAPLFNLQLRSIEASVLERRIAKLEKRLAQFDKEVPEKGRAA